MTLLEKCVVRKATNGVPSYNDDMNIIIAILKCIHAVIEALYACTWILRLRIYIFFI